MMPPPLQSGEPLKPARRAARVLLLPGLDLAVVDLGTRERVVGAGAGVGLVHQDRLALQTARRAASERRDVDVVSADRAVLEL
jgi:hypothetical protein